MFVEAGDPRPAEVLRSEHHQHVSPDHRHHREAAGPPEDPVGTAVAFGGTREGPPIHEPGREDEAQEDEPLQKTQVARDQLDFQ